MDNITLDSLASYLDFFRTLYDVVRLVDPVEKCVLEYGQNRFVNVDDICHQYWGTGGICDNCISVRAHQNGKCFMKLEQSEKAIMLVTAMPIENQNRPVVVELLRNATDTMLVGTGIYNEGNPMGQVLREINHSMVSDELTDLFNRRYTEERLPADLLKALIEKKPLSVIFMDIDNFKSINDTFGHTWGDQMIQRVAATLSQQIRGREDWAARLGGDEFLICLPGTSAREARQVAERICEKIREVTVCDEDGIEITASLGVYTTQHELLNAKDLIRLADERMYRAKELGKNQVYADQDEP